MKRMGIVVTGVVAWMAAAAPAVVAAQQAGSVPAVIPSDDPATLAQARALFEQSVVALRESRHDEACSLLTRALRLRDSASIRRNLAICHRALGQPVEAREHLLAFVRMAAEGDPAVEAARAEIDALSRRIARVTVVVSRRPRGMRVTLDGAPLAEAALDSPRPSNPGRHVIEARAPGHLPFRTEVDAVPGGEVTISLALVRNPRVAAEDWISERRAPRRGARGAVAARAERSRPITERWWFWTGIGVLAAGVAAGATAAIVGSSGGGGESPPPGFSGVIETSGR